MRRDEHRRKKYAQYRTLEPVAEVPVDDAQITRPLIPATMVFDPAPIGASRGP